MKIHGLIYGLCLIAMGASGGHAQAPAAGAGNAPTDAPKVDNGTAKTPNTIGSPIPEVVQPTAQHGDIIQPKSAEDSSAVLKPPNVDPNMTVGHVPPGAANSK
jgi:hypothetical protein